LPSQRGCPRKREAGYVTLSALRSSCGTGRRRSASSLSSATTAQVTSSIGAGVVVEILALNRDQPAEPGEIGRIVVTDLHNRAMPIIRYDTGDVGAFATTSDGAPDPDRLAIVEGRRLDRIYAADGHPVSSFIFYKAIWSTPQSGSSNWCKRPLRTIGCG